MVQVACPQIPKLISGLRSKEACVAVSDRIPSGYVKIAIENGPTEIVDLPIKNGDFP